MRGPGPASAPHLAALASALLTASPASAQLSTRSIEAAHSYSAQHDGIALIVKERGLIRFERYYNGHSKAAPLHIFSGTKSFFGVLAVIAQEDGLLTLDEPAADTLHEWRRDPRKSQITIRHLLNFTSGLESGFDQIYAPSPEDKIARSLTLRANREPGRSFTYGPGHLNAFCEILRRKLAPQGISYHQYLERKLTRPLGITMHRWREDDRGNPVPSAGMHMTSHQWMKLGDLINSGGSWNGRQLVKPESLAHCFTGTAANPAFGLCFWLNRHAGQPGAREFDVETTLDRKSPPEIWRGAILSKHAPPDLIVSLGSSFQRLYLVPSMDLLVVHHGRRGDSFRDADFLRTLFQDAILPVRPDTAKPPPPNRSILRRLFQPKKNSPQEYAPRHHNL